MHFKCCLILLFEWVGTSQLCLPNQSTLREEEGTGTRDNWWAFRKWYVFWCLHLLEALHFQTRQGGETLPLASSSPLKWEFGMSPWAVSTSRRNNMPLIRSTRSQLEACVEGHAGMEMPSYSTLRAKSNLGSILYFLSVLRFPAECHMQLFDHLCTARKW